MRALLILAALVAVPAAAQTPAVDGARATGVVGERYDGYLGFAAAASAQLKSQVAAINIRRRSLYSNLAASRGASPQEVGIAAGCQLLSRVGVGQAYMLGDGIWHRRAAGQPVPIPGYCR
jgi:uncharacterized protein YdbL (DUF1318 family)